MGAIHPARRAFPILLALLLNYTAPVHAAIDRKYCAPDPYANPELDICNPLRYIPSNALTGVSFSLILLAGILQTVYTIRWGAKFMLAMVIGCYTFALGLGLRFGLYVDPQNSKTYIVYYLFVVLSPCAFIAADYVLLGRMALHLGMQRHLVIPAHRLTVIFITSDITTFLIQAAGGGMSAGASDEKTAKTAQKIFLAGLAMQLISFVIFTVIYLLWLFRIVTKEKGVWKQDADKSLLKDWRTLAAALVLSCIGILIRSCFRTIELSQGYHGELATSEPHFYGLDTLPLFIAVAVYVIVWPGRIIPDGLKHVRPSRKGKSMEGGIEMNNKESGDSSVEGGSETSNAVRPL